jgi:replicative DNA helicase
MPHSVEQQLPDTYPILSLINYKLEAFEDPYSNRQKHLTGIKELDSIGFGTNELVVVAGRPGIGKTNWFCNLAMGFSTKTPTAFLSMDHTAKNIANRSIALMNNISLNTIESEDFTSEQVKTIRKSQEKFKYRKLYINETQFNDINELSQYLKSSIANKGIQVFFIDYMQKLIPSLNNLQDNEANIATIMRQLRIICKQHNVCIFLAVQINKKQAPSNTEIIKAFDSLPAIETEADKLLFMLDREPLAVNKSPIEMQIDLKMVKNRSGACVTTTIGADILKKDTSDDDDFVAPWEV